MNPVGSSSDRYRSFGHGELRNEMSIKKLVAERREKRVFTILKQTFNTNENTSRNTKNKERKKESSLLSLSSRSEQVTLFPNSALPLSIT
jgi:gamma-glutamylcysteine synthetase